MKKMIALLLALLMAVGMLAGCAKQNDDDTNTTTDELRIVTTIFPEYDWVKEILGDKADHADITMLLDNGVDLHSYQPTADDIVKISDCDLFIYVGGESEGWVEDALKKAYAKNRAKGEAEPSANNISATIDRATGEIHVYTRRLIVEEVEKPADQISLEEARAIKDSYQMGDIVETDVTPRNFLRVAAQTAKGVIMQRLRDAERGRQV